MHVLANSMRLNYGSAASLKNHQKNPNKNNQNKTQKKVPEAKRNVLITRLTSSTRWAPHLKCSITYFSRNFQSSKKGDFVSLC